MKRATAAETIARLDAIKAGDQEAAHGDAEAAVVAYLPGPVREAYVRCHERTGPWWWA